METTRSANLTRFPHEWHNCQLNALIFQQRFLYFMVKSQEMEPPSMDHHGSQIQETLNHIWVICSSYCPDQWICVIDFLVLDSPFIKHPNIRHTVDGCEILHHLGWFLFLKQLHKTTPFSTGAGVLPHYGYTLRYTNITTYGKSPCLMGKFTINGHVQ